MCVYILYRMISQTAAEILSLSPVILNLPNPPHLSRFSSPFVDSICVFFYSKYTIASLPNPATVNIEIRDAVTSVSAYIFYSPFSELTRGCKKKNMYIYIYILYSIKIIIKWNYCSPLYCFFLSIVLTRRN